MFGTQYTQSVHVSPLKSVTLSQRAFVIALLSKDGETEHHTI